MSSVPSMNAFVAYHACHQHEDAVESSSTESRSISPSLSERLSRSHNDLTTAQQSPSLLRRVFQNLSYTHTDTCTNASNQEPMHVKDDQSIFSKLSALSVRTRHASDGSTNK